MESEGANGVSDQFMSPTHYAPACDRTLSIGMLFHARQFALAGEEGTCAMLLSIILFGLEYLRPSFLQPSFDLDSQARNAADSVADYAP